ncbi:flagellar hook-basal body protein FliE [Rhodospirillum rubrum F11]|uniref:Flagellar hook-basal body complex protein FliE n=2 Tax=Rhodospirillum rubrum TaxID=1085 RepID=Q2RQH4_RHORT|nr:flagellar hook-basal body complex protein FliE [Rhodospirillum rubrum]ABC23621.1 Flagellar hook-basal body complex protein FliE [Rhodospirillum rubrum ATCC 11170]AEO49359.1 flagellar hook-basal body protein FliE [Rhodospirillum rubrum F11]MBK5955298.1 flagellar hook-basal body complex protein FliE [Rhodospirillum rubrum]QXG79582.1 flagellar hook-basal body complex protein FliE [Rhodospirillum rubrum]HCF18070.1 flagellar hook-basal body complex protein FliE [Rhodospirillum rubrum]
MAVDFASAVSAYKSASRIGGAEMTGGLLPSGQPEGPSFASMVKGAIDDTITAGRQGEAQSRLAIEGKADLRDVVMAVNNAESTLQTVVAVRDKVVNAYETILRMPI